MANMLTGLLLSLVAATPVPGMKEAEKMPLNESGALIVRILPHASKPADGNYVIEDEKPAVPSYEEMKEQLDERFAHMFDLKAELDKQQSEMSNKWDEYYTLHEKYNRELKRIIAMWVMEQNYNKAK